MHVPQQPNRLPWRTWSSRQASSVSELCKRNSRSLQRPSSSQNRLRERTVVSWAGLRVTARCMKISIARHMRCSREKSAPPVSSPFGVHLILCEEARPGNRTFQQQREAVQQAAKRFLFRRLADQQRLKSKVNLVTDTKDD